MAFSFGSTSTPAPAAPAPAQGPAGGGFSFGAPATSTPAAAPSSTGFSFGGGSAPTTSSTPAPSSGFSFANSSTTSAPAPSAFGFGATSPAPTSTLGGTSSSSSLFGGTSTTFPSTSNTTSFQTTQPQQQSLNAIMTANTPYKLLPPNVQKLIDDIFNMKHQHEQTMASISTMQPSLLQPTSGTMVSIQNVDSADMAAGSTQIVPMTPSTTSSSLLDDKIKSIQKDLTQMKNELQSFQSQTNDIQTEIESTLEMIIKCGVYPLQSTIARRGGGSGSSTGGNDNGSGINKEQLLKNISDLQKYITSHSPSSSTTTTDMTQRLNNILLENSVSVDYIEGMPSVYLWNVIDELVDKMNRLYGRLKRLSDKSQRGQDKLNQESQVVGMTSRSNGRHGEDIVEELNVAIQDQIKELVRVSDYVARLKDQMEQLRRVYTENLVRDSFQKHKHGSLGMRGYANIIGVPGPHITGNNVLDPFAEADQKEREYERRLEIEVHRKRIEAAPPSNAIGQSTANAPTTAAPSTGLFGATTPAPAVGGGLFGSTNAPASGGLFGSTSAPAAPGGLFGSTPAPATGGMFGSTPAPAPTGGLFGSTPAPATTGGTLFGSTPAPAPGGLFGQAATTPAQPAASTSFSFGNTVPTAAAPPTGGLFGSTTATAAPSSSSGFGGTSSSSSSSTSRTRRKSSGGGRRR